MKYQYNVVGMGIGMGSGAVSSDSDGSNVTKRIAETVANYADAGWEFMHCTPLPVKLKAVANMLSGQHESFTYIYMLTFRKEV